MAQRFRGEGVHKVDSKGRVSIPALFRRVLEASDPDWTDGLNPNVVIVYGGKTQNYLEAYTQEAIQEVDDKIARLPRGSKQRRALEHIFNSQSLPTQTDDTGRLVLPAKLREKIGITNEAKFVAMGDTFQIWAPDAFDDRNADIEDWLDEQGEDFDPLELLEMAPEPSPAE
ncbi:division/cell wall cluster transcriptional repressor MraZ [uncultured Litoreibacter sp.]|uniref:division/cell wall cluster transcriptional repressor MraZ n=1 Tax=uncultured Litoreibacter sp. TaxID=1392394 RepID=UPI002632714B|nr:division/cell wall cluster transcriptional repressor MraZ [uncultured Litoreibacter sp.]